MRVSLPSTVLLVVGVVCTVPFPLWSREPARPRGDATIREEIVRESVAAYLASGRPCACPYSTTRSGSSCGGRSAYSRPGGAAPMCYPQDVPDAMVAARRR